MNLRRLHWFTAALCGACLCAQAAEPAQTVVIEAVAPGEILYNYETGVGVITNDFVVRLKDATLSAHQGDFNEKTGQFRVEGDVFLQQDNQVWRGERLDYNYLTKKIGSDEFRAGRAPFYAAGEGLALDFTQKVYTATNAFVTSDDSYNPAYRVKTRRLTIAPGKYFEAQDAVVYLGSVPIFYFPYLRRNLDGPMNHVTVLPGYRSVWGAFLLGAYDWYWNDNLQGAVHLDYRTKRGVGAGLDVQYDLGQAGRGDAKFYYAHDLDPSAQIPEGDPVPGKNREMFFLVHRANPLTNLTANLVVRQLSDPYVTHDFFQNLYEENVQPSSFVEARRLWPDFSLNLLVQPQVNEFYQTVERLPSIHLTPARQQIGTTPLYYEGDNSVGYFEQAYAAGRYATTPPSNNYAAFRADTFHQVLLPQTLFGWLNVAPRVGGRFTFYGHENGEDADLSAVDRWVFTTGMEVNFKLSRLWSHATNSLFDVDGLRHVIQPTFNYTWIPEPSASPSEIPQFDYRLPSLTLLPIVFPDNNNIDSITQANVLRLGLRNRLQTMRGGEMDNLVNWNLLVDYNLNPQDGLERFSDVFSSIDLRPRRWLTLSSGTRVDVQDVQMVLASQVITLTPNDVWSLSIGHYYQRDDPEIGLPVENNLLATRLYFRLNENWGFRFSHQYEIDDHMLQNQQYSIYRDFGPWTGALSFRVQQSVGQPTDYGVVFTFQLKAFPRFKLGDDINKPNLLLGG